MGQIRLLVFARNDICAAISRVDRGVQATGVAGVATNKGGRWFFVFGFEKSDRANIAPDELEALQNIAHELLARTGSQLDLAVSERVLEEICHVH